MPRKSIRMDYTDEEARQRLEAPCAARVLWAISPKAA
jgi:hypothetical protein